MKIGLQNLFVCCVIVVVAACGGGGGSDSQSELARINAANAEQLGTAATEGAKQAVQYQTVPNFGFRPAGNSVLDVVNEKLSLHYGTAVAVEAPGSIVCDTGSFVEASNPDGSITVTFDMCDIGFGVVVDGAVEANSSTAGNITTVDLLYVDFSIYFAGEVVLVDLEAHCTTDNSSMETSCAFLGVTGFDGRIYDFTDSSVTFDATSGGYLVTSTIVDPDHGRFTITTNAPIIFDCPNGQPLSGELQFTDGAGVLVTVTFNGCDSFTLSYNSTSEIYNW